VLSSVSRLAFLVLFGVIVFGRRRKPPANLRPQLERNERVLAWARVAGDPGSAVVVTTYGLWLPGRTERLGWHLVHKATWTGSRLNVVPGRPVGEGPTYTVMTDDTPIDVALAEPRDVPPTVRERVTKSVAYTAHYPLPGGGVRVVGRREAGANGLRWHVRYDEGTDVSDPDVQAFTAEVVAEASNPTPP
jgi:hypothetical protein